MIAIGSAQLDLQRAVAQGLGGGQALVAGDVGEEQGEGGAIQCRAEAEQGLGGLVGQADAAILDEDQAGLRIARHQPAQQPVGQGGGWRGSQGNPLFLGCSMIRYSMRATPDRSRRRRRKRSDSRAPRPSSNSPSGPRISSASTAPIGTASRRSFTPLAVATRSVRALAPPTGLWLSSRALLTVSISTPS